MGRVDSREPAGEGIRDQHGNVPASMRTKGDKIPRADKGQVEKPSSLEKKQRRDGKQLQRGKGLDSSRAKGDGHAKVARVELDEKQREALRKQRAAVKKAAQVEADKLSKKYIAQLKVCIP